MESMCEAASGAVNQGNRLAPQRLAIRRFATVSARAFALVRHAAPRESAIVGISQILTAAATLAQLALAGHILVRLTSGSPITLGAVSLPLMAATAVLVVGSLLEAINNEVSLILVDKVAVAAHQQVLRVAGAATLEAYETPTFHDRLLRAQTQTDEHAWQVVQGSLRLATGIVGALVAGLVLLRTAPLVAVIASLAALPLWLAGSRNAQQAYQLAFDQTPLERERSYLQGLLTSRAEAAEIRVYNLASYFQSRYARLSAQRLLEITNLAKRRMKRSAIASIASAVVGAVALLALVSLLASGTVSVPAAGVAVLALSQLQSRVAALAIGATLLRQAAQFLDDHVSFTTAAPRGARRDPSRSRSGPFRQLSVHNVSFSYPGTDRVVLRDISMTLRRGEVVGLIGKNGSGKSTLTRLICGLYEPSAGTIQWSDPSAVDSGFPTEEDSVALLAQDYARYALTVRENVGLGDLSRLDDMPSIRYAASLACATALPAELQWGWDTRLSREYEDGAELSVGQWQRLALARAFLSPAPILILDEPTSALDRITTERLSESIRSAAAARAILLITHDPALLHICDRIYLLDDGHLTEQTPESEAPALGVYTGN